jgi:hypothetical protein
MKKSTSLLSMSLLAVSLVIPTVRSYADDNPPGNHRQREALRQDQRELERLRDQRRREIREGDRRETREYNDKIRDKKKEIWQDRREIYGNDHDRRNDRDGRYGWWYGQGERYGYRDRQLRYDRD